MLCFCQDLRVILDSLVALVFLEILERLELLVGDHHTCLQGTAELNCCKSSLLMISLLLFDL